jgi:MYXO-CTERM domain-containing protein
MLTFARLSAVAAVLAVSTPAFAQQEQLEVLFDLAQYSHPGSWSFSVGCTHNPATGRTNYVHLTVVWLEDANGNYVTTLHRWGRSYLFDLKAWSVQAGLGIDGVTSATPTSQAAAPAQVFKTFTTGPLDISKVPDGNYRIRIETTQCELADSWRVTPNPNPFAGGSAFGPIATFNFTKGRANQTNAVLGSTTPFNNVRVNYTIGAANAPPGVWAGVDQWKMPSTTPADATTTLTATVSDPAGTPTVAWTLVGTRPAGLTATIATPSAASTQVTFTQAGVYTFRATATDASNATSFDEVNVFVNARLLPSAGDAEVASGNATVAMGIIENAGPWTWAAGPTNTTGSRAYLRFDTTSITQQIVYAALWLRPAEQNPTTTLVHDFYILTDAQDDWNGPANTSTDQEGTVTWNNQVITNGNPSLLLGTQLAGSANHLPCLFRHAYTDPDANPGEAATQCPSRMDVELNMTNVRQHDANKIWSFFMTPRNFVALNGLGLGSDENAVSMQLLAVVYWQSGPNQAPVAVPGTYATVVDNTSPLGTQSVQLDASGSTDDAAIVTYEWRENNVLVGASSTPTITLNLSLGVHTLELKVIDGGGLSSTANTTVMVEDRYEPNHARAMAATVTGASAGQAYSDLFASAAAPAGDWYGVDLVAGSNLTVAVTMTGGNLDLRLYDPSGALLQTAATAALTETATLTASTAGKYFIQVDAAAPANASRYAMTVTTSNAITVTLNPSSGVESAGTLSNAGTVTLDAPAASAVTVNLTSQFPAQLGFVTNPVTIAVGSTSAQFSITLVNDPAGVPNASRFVNITASAAGYNSGSAQFEILDDEAALFVGWDKAGETVSETGSPQIQLKATLSGPATTAVTIPFTVTGTASRGSDFTTPIAGGTLTINSGTTATYLISLVDDAEIDPDETVIVTMGTPTGATASGTTVYTLTIGDDDGTGAGGGAGGGGGTTTGTCSCSSAGGGLALALLWLAAALRRRSRR